MGKRSPTPSRWALVLSCEHASARIPAAYRDLFAGAEEALSSHRAYDRGSLDVARALARRFGVEVHAGKWSRLVVDLNRSSSNPAVFSAWTRNLPGDRENLLREIHAAHHRAVASAVDTAGRRRPVVHVSVHSFAPVLRGKVRTADVGLLYDPRRSLERQVVGRWKSLMSMQWPELRVRRNYPYRGVSDGLTRCLRREFPDGAYAGIELEINQGAMENAGQWQRLRRAVVDSLVALLDGAQEAEVGRLARGRAR